MNSRGTHLIVLVAVQAALVQSLVNKKDDLRGDLGAQKHRLLKADDDFARSGRSRGGGIVVCRSSVGGARTRLWWCGVGRWFVTIGSLLLLLLWLWLLLLLVMCLLAPFPLRKVLRGLQDLEGKRCLRRRLYERMRVLLRWELRVWRALADGRVRAAGAAGSGHRGLDVVGEYRGSGGGEQVFLRED